MLIYCIIIYFYYVYLIINSDFKKKKNNIIVRLLNIIHSNKSLNITSFMNLIYPLNINISK